MEQKEYLSYILKYPKKLPYKLSGLEEKAVKELFVEKHPERLPIEDISNVYVDFVRTTYCWFSRLRCFVVETKTGEKKRFSRKRCFPKKYKYHNKVFRDLVTPQIKDYRKKNLISGTEVEIDHKFPKTFYNLLCTFLQQEKISVISELELEDSSGILYLKDKDLEKRWVQFHKENAELEVLNRKDHTHVNQTFSKVFKIIKSKNLTWGIKTKNDILELISSFTGLSIEQNIVAQNIFIILLDLEFLISIEDGNYTNNPNYVNKHFPELL